jgi:hypothetical protein
MPRRSSIVGRLRATRRLQNELLAYRASVVEHPHGDISKTLATVDENLRLLDDTIKELENVLSQLDNA